MNVVLYTFGFHKGEK